MKDFQSNRPLSRPPVAPRANSCHYLSTVPDDTGDINALDAAFERIRDRDGRYHERAYLFVLAALEFAQGRLPARRHLTGGELAWACKDFALEQFGLLAGDVLSYWNVRATEDLGRIVFLLIDVGLLARQASDRIEDFAAVYDFATEFRAAYHWPGVERA